MDVINDIKALLHNQETNKLTEVGKLFLLAYGGQKSILTHHLVHRVKNNLGWTPLEILVRATPVKLLELKNVVGINFKKLKKRFLCSETIVNLNIIQDYTIPSSIDFIIKD